MRESWLSALCRVPRLSPAQLRRRHAEMLALAALVVIGSASLDLHGAQGVALRGVPAAVLPELCGARALFGVNCPGCGLTRSFLHLARGRWREAWRVHRLGWLLAGLVLLQFPYRIVALSRPQMQILPQRVAQGIAYGLIFLLLTNWVCQLVGI